MTMAAHEEVVPKHGLTALHVAAMQDDVDAIHALLSRGCHVDSLPDEGFDKASHAATTPLWMAASKGRVGALEALLGAGADVSTCNRRGCSALEVAVQKRRWKAVPVLVRAGAKLEASSRAAGKCMAAVFHSRAHSVIPWLVKAGVDVDRRVRVVVPNWGRRPLMATLLTASVATGLPAFVMALLEAGAQDLRYRHPRWPTSGSCLGCVVDYATTWGELGEPIVRAMLRAGADLSEPNATPLLQRCLPRFGGNDRQSAYGEVKDAPALDMALLLLELGAPWDGLESRTGNNLLHSMVLTPCYGMLSAGFILSVLHALPGGAVEAMVNQRNVMGLTPLGAVLTMFLRQGKLAVAVARAYLEAGADPRIAMGPVGELHRIVRLPQCMQGATPRETAWEGLLPAEIARRRAGEPLTTAERYMRGPHPSIEARWIEEAHNCVIWRMDLPPLLAEWTQAYQWLTPRGRGVMIRHRTATRRGKRSPPGGAA